MVKVLDRWAADLKHVDEVAAHPSELQNVVEREVLFALVLHPVAVVVADLAVDLPGGGAALAGLVL